MATPQEPIKKPYQLIAPPKEFFRAFANLAHNRVLSEDFPHEKHLTIKYKGTAPEFLVNAKGSLNITSEEVKKKEEIQGKVVETTKKEDSYATSSEVKFLTGYRETSTDARFNNKGIVKLWTNWGVHKIGEPIEFVSVVKGDTLFQKTKAWVAGFYTRGAFGVAARLQGRKEKGAYSFSFADKLTYSKKDFWGGLYVDLNLTDLKLTQYNAVVGYNLNKKIHFYAEHGPVIPPKPAKKKPAETKVTETKVTVTDKITVDEKTGVTTEKTTTDVKVKEGEELSLLKKIGFRRATFNGVYKDDKFFALAQVGWEEPTEKFSFDAGVVYTVNQHSSVRAKINQDLNLAVGARHKFNKNISLNIGTLVLLKTPEKFYDSFQTVPIPFGASLEFNF